MNLQSEWVTRGYFDIKDPAGGKSLTQRIRASIGTALGRKPEEIRLASYPVGPAWRYALWWREGDVDYAEAQFYAGISPDFPILAAGISVEKGLDVIESPATGGRRMDRASWDWPRFVERSVLLLEKDVPECSSRIGRPVVIRFRVPNPGAEKGARKASRTFVYDGGTWFERHTGNASPEDICAYVRELDGRGDWWVNTHMCCDLSAIEVGSMDDEDLARIRVEFAPLRSRIRGKGPLGAT